MFEEKEYILICALLGTIAVIKYSNYIKNKSLYSKPAGPYFFPGDYGDKGLYDKSTNILTERELQRFIKKEEKENANIRNIQFRESLNALSNEF